MKRKNTEQDTNVEKKPRLSAKQFLKNLSTDLSQALRDMMDVILVEKDIVFLQDLMHASPLLEELYAIIEKSSAELGERLKDSEWHLIFESLHTIVMVAYNDTDEERMLVSPLLKKFIGNEVFQMKILDGLNKSNTSARIRMRLRLLALAASLNESMAKTCAKIILPETGMWKWLLNRRDSRISEDVRATTIALICAMLNSKLPVVVQKLMEKKGILRYALNDLQYDSPNSIKTLCWSIKRGILANKDITKSTKIDFFTPNVVKCFCQTLISWKGISGWQEKNKDGNFNGVDPEEIQIVCSSIEDMLCFLLCSSKHGIKFSDEGPADQRNYPVLKILQIMPMGNRNCINVVCRVLSISPRLCERYLEYAYSRFWESDEATIYENVLFVSTLLRSLKYSLDKGIIKYHLLPKLHFLEGFPAFKSIQTSTNADLIVSTIELVCNILELEESLNNEQTLIKIVPPFSTLLSLSRKISINLEDKTDLVKALQVLILLYTRRLHELPGKVNFKELKWAFKFILPKHLDAQTLVDFLNQFDPTGLQIRNANCMGFLLRPLFSACSRVYSQGNVSSALTKFLKRFGHFDHNTFELPIWFDAMLTDSSCAKTFSKVVFRCICNCHPLYNEIFEVNNTEVCKPIISCLEELSRRSLCSLRADTKKQTEITDYDKRVPFSILLPATFDFLQREQASISEAFELAVVQVIGKLLVVQPGISALFEYLKQKKSVLENYKQISSLIEIIETKPHKLKCYLPGETDMQRCINAWTELMQRDTKGEKYLAKFMTNFSTISVTPIKESVEGPSTKPSTDISKKDSSGVDEIWDRLVALCSRLTSSLKPSSITEISTRLAQLDDSDLQSLSQSVLTSVDEISLRICSLIAPRFKNQECLSAFKPLFSWAVEEIRPDLEETIVDLLILSFSFCASALKLEQAKFWLSRYKLTMSVHQQKLLRILWLYDLYLECSLLEWRSFGWHGCAESTLVGCMFSLQREIMERSIFEFPDCRTLVSRAICTVENEEIYDPAFLVPYLYHCFSKTDYILDCRQLCGLGLIGYCCRALSSHCRIIRTIAMLALCNLEDNLQEQRNREAAQVCFFLEKLRASNRSIKRLDTFVSLMLAACSEKLCNAGSVMFLPICRYLRRSAFFTLNTFPMYTQWFLSSNVKAVEQRRFVIMTSRGGLSDTSSYALIKNKAIHGMLSMLFAPDWIINTSDRNNLLQIFCHAVQNRGVCELLIREQALPLFLHLIKNSTQKVLPHSYRTFPVEFPNLQYLREPVVSCMNTMADFYLWQAEKCI